MESLSLTEAIVDIFKNSGGKTAPGTQAELMDCLKSKNIEVTQSSVSRALKKLGAIKTINDIGRQVYTLPSTERHNVYIEERDQLARYIEFIDSNEMVIVIKTGPGTAQLVSVIIDHLESPMILGTVAGDDTILVIPRSIKDLVSLQQFLESLI